MLYQRRRGLLHPLDTRTQFGVLFHLARTTSCYVSVCVLCVYAQCSSATLIRKKIIAQYNVIRGKKIGVRISEA